MSAISGSMESGQASSSSLPIRISCLGPWRICPRFGRCSDQKLNTRHRIRNVAPGCAASRIPDGSGFQSRVSLHNPLSGLHTEISPLFSPCPSAEGQGGLLCSTMAISGYDVLIRDCGGLLGIEAVDDLESARLRIQE